MVALFWTTSVLNNYALGFKVSVPVHIVFRSGSLFVSMLISWLFFNRKYSISQIFGVILVTLGVVLATIPPSMTSVESTDHTLGEWWIGISTLSVALVISCFLGQLQQDTYATYGKHWREGLFYTHALSLPGFLIFHQNILDQISAYNASSPFDFASTLHPYISKVIEHDAVLSVLQDIHIPRMWLFLLSNVVTQYLCIAGVHKLSSIASSVTLNLVLTIRKFISLLLSIIIFKNQFTLVNWAGALSIFVGTVFYSLANTTQVASSTTSRRNPSRKAKKA